ncbi:PREDICTED: alpha-1-antitrypsin-like [Propithecus coquereli]|uniref:alpha-1-antitrypsin-like n=1 Tax=Propithecus coquereli TaxID=379532 RepID=UPI00063F9A87|nr:PREDICTED: alpha-1-antitrypsin-like [Propithecus coquereli]
MAHPILSLWLLVAGLAPHACGQGVPDQKNHPIPRTPSASSTFLNNSHLAFSLYRQMVAPNPDRNVLFSPLSFSLPLTLLALQARPEVRTRVLRGLGLSLAEVPENQAHVYYSQQLRSFLPSPEECHIDMDSLLFVNLKQRVLQKFVDTAQNLYRTEVFLISFENDQLAQYEMDFFTRKKTHGKIGNLFEEVDKDTVLVLANYIFFKGKWRHSFDPKLTVTRPFWVSERLTIPVPMMQRLGRFQLQHFPQLHSHVLRLPYSCNSTAVFILPDMGKVGETEEALMKEDFDTWTQPFPLRKRKLYFPKFSLPGKIQLDKLLPAVGISDIFSYHAKLSGISLQTMPMKVSKAEHRAELTADEEGAEEEDTTDLQALDKQYLPALHFNRPFLLLVFEDGSRSLLFMGKVLNPKTDW